MKKNFTKAIGVIVMLGLIVAIALPARAQYVKKVIDNTGYFTAMTKDANGNIYVIKAVDSYKGSVLKYTANSTSFITIFTGLDMTDESDPDGGDAPWGLAVNSIGDVYLTSNFKQGNTASPDGQLNYVNGNPLAIYGSIIRLAAGPSRFNAITYAPSVFLNGGLFYTGLAFDASDNLYVLQESDSNLDASEVVKYANNPGTGIPSTSGTALFNNLNDDISDNFPHNLAIASNGDIYVTNSGEISQEIAGGGSGHKGDVRRYKSSGGYSNSNYVEVSQNTYPMALALDPNNNLYVEETDGGSTPYQNYRINIYNSSNVLTGSDVAALDATNVSPDGITAVSSGNFYAIDGADPGAIWEFTGPVSGQATNVGASAIGATTATINWTNGGGANRAVFMEQGTSGNPTVSNSTNYNGNAAFTSGSSAGTGWYCIYNGTGSSVSVTGLTPGKPYLVQVEEYNGSTALTNENYLTSTASNNPNGFNTATPTINAPGGTTTVPSTTESTAGSSTSFNITGTNLIGNVTVNAPTNFQVSSDNSTWGSTATITANGTLASTPVYVRLAGTGSTGTQSGNVALSSTSATTVNQAVSGTILTPTITVPGGTTTLTSTTSGTQGASTSFTISATNLSPASGSLTITAPSNVQVSPDNSTWNSSYTQSYSGSTLGSTPVYERLSGTGSVGTISGNVSISGGGATTVTQAVSGTLNSASTTISSLTAVSSTLTNASTIQWTATFAASVSNLSTADFTLNNTGSVSGASIASVSGSGTSWTVTVNTGSGDGTIQLEMNSASGLTPSVSNLPFSGTTYTIDKTKPTATISAPSVTYANSSAAISYTVTFTDANMNTGSLSNFGALSVFENSTTTGSATINSISVGAYTHSGNNYTFPVTFNDMTGDGTLSFSVPAGTVSDNAGNTSSASAASTNVIIDNTAPVVIIGAPSTTTTSAGPVTYDVSYSDANFNTSSLSASNVTLNSTGGASASVAVTQNSATDYTVTLSGITGSGSLGISIASGTSSDLAGNTDAGAGPSATFTVTQPVAINSLSAASSSPTNASSVNYTATFASAITGLSASNFSIAASGPSGTSVGTPTSGDGGITWTVPVNTGSGDGTIQLALANATGITQGISTSLPFAGDTYTIDKTPPTVAINAPSPTITSAGPVSYTVTFADANFGSSSLSSADIFPNVTRTGTADFSNAVVTGSGTSYTVTFSGVIGDGTLGFTVPAGKATDLAGNQSPASSPSATFTVDNTPPTAAISAPSAASIGNNGSGTVTYTVTYADANFNTSNLTNAGITLNTTGTANGTFNVSGGGTTYTVTISNISGFGTLGITLAGGYASDLAGNTDAGAAPSATFNVVASDAILANLTISNGALTPGFSSTNYTYTDAIANLTSGITVVPTVDDPNATITVNGNLVASGVRSSSIPMSVGANTVTIVVTAQDGVTTQTYTVTVNRPLPNNAVLSSLTLSPTTTLVGTTGPGNYNFNASVANSTTSIQALPTAQDGLATITVNSSAVTSGSLSQSIPLNVGANTITTVVTAEDGVTTKTYIITVTRAGAAVASLANLAISTGTLSPAFSTSTNAYVATVPYTTTFISFTPTTTDPNATVTVNGATVPSGSASGPITLSVGSNKVVTTITAQNGATKQTYNTVVTRLAPSSNAQLASITTTPSTTLMSTTGAGYLNYTAVVSNTTTSIQVTPTSTDPTATITVNSSPVASGSLSQVIPLNVGANTITTVLTAQDGVTTKTVIITVNRAASTNAALASLTVNTGTLTPAFATGTYTYSVSVPNTVNGINITPTTADATATITVGGAPTNSGSPASAGLALGLNSFPVVVTAQDGKTTLTYTINVTRVPSSNSFLTSISLTPNATLVGTTGPGYYNYTAAVGFSVSSVQVTPVTTDATATVTVNGSTVASGSLSQAIALNVGANTITTVVTAQDGTTKTAIITVNRAGAAVASLSNLTISAGTLSPAFATATINYTATVAYPNATVNLTPTTTDPNATVTVNGTAATSGVGSTVALSVGLNKILTVVTAQNGTTKSTYTTYITRTAPSTNALYASIVLNPVSTLVGTTGPGYLNYTSAVANSESSVQVIPTAKDATATITVNGSSVASGSPSSAIALNVGANTITIVITAQDGVTSKNAIITVNRAAPQPLNNLNDPISVTKPTDVVTLEDGITVHQAVSPNGDGINDFLTIDGIASFPNNSLMIVDRNGAMVYQAKGYDNSSKLFDGHSSINGKMQLPGTYFYSLDYTAANGESKHKTGYIILKY